MIVFSEYRATQRYLQERLAARGIARWREDPLVLREHSSGGAGTDVGAGAGRARLLARG